MSRLPAFPLKGLVSNLLCSRCRLHGCTTSSGPEKPPLKTASTYSPWLHCNLCIPVVCDKLCQHITLVKHFSCIIHPGAYIPHGHFQIPLKLIPPSLINSLACAGCVAAYDCLCHLCWTSHLSETILL